ncbi:MAG: hypothetical protein ACRYFV_09335 [Janthinobacterium lividum]|jgi:hypothetical protein
MFEHILLRSNGQEFCRASYSKKNHWIKVAWQGFVNTPDSEYGANEIRRLLSLTHSPYLLNDNSQVHSPWFDSVDLLEHLWVTDSEQPTLQYVAHVLQPHVGDGLGRRLDYDLFAGKFEFQFFSTHAEAANWLHECQLHNNLHYQYVHR